MRARPYFEIFAGASIYFININFFVLNGLVGCIHCPTFES